MKRILALLLAVLLTAGLFSGCRKSGVSALYFAADGTAGSFDPQVAARGAVSIVVRNTFEGLVMLDAAGKPQPAAASSWTVTNGGKTYTFSLRQGAKWHVSDTVRGGMGEKLPEDFAPNVTAADFVFALRRAVDPTTGAEDAALLKNVAGAVSIMAGEAAPDTLGVRALGEYTLEIRLEKPESGFLETLTQPLCMPCNREFFEATGGRYGLLMKYIISNGPFYMTRFEDTSFRLVRDENYTGPYKAKTDVIWIYSDLTEDAAAQQLSERELSGAYSADPAVSAKARGCETLSADDIMRGILMNCADDTLSNADIRKALVTAANVTTMCNVAGKTPAAALCPGSLSPVTSFQAGDNASAAQKLLQKALTELQTEDVSLTLLCEEQYDASLRYLLQIWQIAFGIKCSVSLSAVTAEELKSRVSSGDYQMAFYPVQAAVYSPAAYFAQFSAETPNSLCSLENEDYDAAVDALRYCDNAALPAAQKKAEQLLAANAVFLPVWNEGTRMLCVQDVKGVTLLSGNDRLYLFGAEQ